MSDGTRTADRLRPVDERILDALRDGPLSVRELEDKLRREIFEGFAESHGFTWPEYEDEPAGLRLTALASSERVLGLVHLHVGRGYGRLRSLEHRGLVERIQVDGHRPMLWRLAKELGR